MGRAFLRRATPTPVIYATRTLITMGGVKVLSPEAPRPRPTNNTPNTPQVAGALKFDYFKVYADDAGATGELDDLVIKDSLTGKVVFTTGFDSANYSGITTLFEPDTPSYKTLTAEQAALRRAGPDDKHEHSFIDQGVIRLVNRGAVGADGVDGQAEEPHVIFTQKLPTNFEITYKVRKLQWGGHLIMLIVPKEAMASNYVGPKAAFGTKIEGSVIKEALVPGYGDTMKNAPAYTTGEWADYSIVMKNKVLTLSINGNVCATCDLNVAPVAPLAPPN